MIGTMPSFKYCLSFSAFVLLAFVYSSSTALAQSCSQVDYCAAASELLTNAEGIRGLPSPTKIRCETVSGERYKKITQGLSARVNSASELRNEGKLFEILGVIPRGYDYEKCMGDGASDSSSALYDRHTKTIVFRSDASLATSLAIHELIHLLQDYNFHLALHEKLEISTDSRLALAALREGDVMLSETFANKADDSVLHPECGVLEGSGYSGACEPSPVLSRILMFPYEWGLRFVNLVREREGYAGVNRAFKNPPRTSREILYPDEFLRGELKQNTVNPSLIKAPREYKLVYRDSFGEFFLRELLKGYLGLGVAGKAAKGWLNDRVALSRSKQMDS